MLNTSSAISFNVGRKYSPAAVGIIQSLVQSPVSRSWDTPSVSKVYSYQACTDEAGTADGMVGAQTLGVMIRDLDKVGRATEARVLKDYSYIPASTLGFNPVKRFQPPSPSTVIYGEQAIVSGFKRWKAYTTFAVEIDLDSRLTPLQAQRYEYRQFIRGAVWYRPWIDDTAGAWVQVDANQPIDSKKAFQIPPYAGAAASTGLPTKAVSGVGLQAWDWKEDGIIRNGKIDKYGYRANQFPTQPREQDEWLGANRFTSLNYRMKDTPSIGNDWGSAANWIELWFDLQFQGFVVETDLAGTVLKVAASKSWTVHKTDDCWIKKTI